MQKDVKRWVILGIVQKIVWFLQSFHQNDLGGFRSKDMTFQIFPNFWPFFFYWSFLECIGQSAIQGIN